MWWLTNLDICQKRDSWKYRPPFFGSDDFRSVFYSIPVTDTETQPLDQPNYAHITVEKGTVNCRNIEHEFNVWADSMNWRFFAREVSPAEFRTLFPNAKSIEELAHFGKFFMKMLPHAIITIEKWSGDIEPFAVMEEAWFEIKGIPMKYGNKSTAFYAASPVGEASCSG
jgi:hypothetical protein